MTAKVKCIEWERDFHDSQVWLQARLTDTLVVVMSSWGPCFDRSGETGRHAKLKSWSCELHAGAGCALRWYTEEHFGKRDVTDDEAKDLAVDLVAQWLSLELVELTARMGK